MYNYKLDATMLPTVFITWASIKNGRFNKRYWLNCTTGEKKDEPEDWMLYEDENDINGYRYNAVNKIGLTWTTAKNPQIWVKSGSTVKYAYVKYHEDIEMLEIAAVGVDTTRKVEPHPWKYLGDRFFIRKDKTLVNQDGNLCNSYRLDEYHIAHSVKELLGMLHRLNANENIVNEFKKFIGKDYFTIGNGRCIQIQYLCHMQEWYKTSQKVKGKGKEAQLVDKLTAIPLSDITDFAVKYPESESDTPNTWSRYHDQIAYFERVNDDWSVIRIILRDKDKASEAYRFYINDAGKCRLTSYSKNEWVTCRSIRMNWNYYAHLVNQDEAIEKCDRIKYALKAMPDTQKQDVMNKLVTMLRFPEIEQLFNLGCKPIAKCALNSSTPRADIKDYFGGYYKEKEKSLLRKVGLTKQQLDEYVSHLDGNYGTNQSYKKAMYAMRKNFDNIASLDQATFTKYLNGLASISRSFWRSIEFYTECFDLDAKRFTSNLIRLNGKNANACRLVHDTLNSAMTLNHGTRPDINWYFDDYSDIVRAHDAVVALKAQQDAERQRYWSLKEDERRKKDEEKRQKIDKERKKYEYEDDNYIIRLPKDLTEIVSEGTKQHICIGGYTNRHAMGDTNLFFLRKKSAPDTPFYAIEMNHDNIIQIHGFGNKWLGNDPDAIPTVIRWLRKNGIKCSDAILTCTAIGYGRTNNYVPMPIVD